MGTASHIASTNLETTTPGRSVRSKAVIGALAVTAANAALWVAGRAADVSFDVITLTGIAAQVGIVAIALTTLLTFALGTGLYALAARRSDRWARAVVIAGVLVAVASTAGPLSTATDTSSGVLLAAMHVLTGAAFAITVLSARHDDRRR